LIRHSRKPSAAHKLRSSVVFTALAAGPPARLMALVHWALSGQAPDYFIDDCQLVADSGWQALRSSRVRTLSLYRTTLQQHVWPTIVLCDQPTFVERLAQRSLQYHSFNWHSWQTSQNATVLCFMKRRSICDSLIFMHRS